MAETAIKSVPLAWGLASVPLLARTLLIAAKGKFDPTKPRDRDSQVSSMSPALQQLAVRLLNSHNNQLETLGFYGAAVAVAVAARVPPETLSNLTGMYIKGRIAYNCAYAVPQIAGGALRSASFLASIASIVLLYMAAAESVGNVY